MASTWHISLPLNYNLPIPRRIFLLFLYCYYCILRTCSCVSNHNSYIWLVISVALNWRYCGIRDVFRTDCTDWCQTIFTATKHTNKSNINGYTITCLLSCSSDLFILGFTSLWIPDEVINEQQQYWHAITHKPVWGETATGVGIGGLPKAFELAVIQDNINFTGTYNSWFIHTVSNYCNFTIGFLPRWRLRFLCSRYWSVISSHFINWACYTLSVLSKMIMCLRKTRKNKSLFRKVSYGNLYFLLLLKLKYPHFLFKVIVFQSSHILQIDTIVLYCTKEQRLGYRIV